MKRSSKHKSIYMLAGCVALMACGLNANAGYFNEPITGLGALEYRNQMPLLSLFYRPRITDTFTLKQKQFEVKVGLDISSISDANKADNYAFSFDQEIYRTTLSAAYGILDNWKIQLEIPTLALTGGFLDGFIGGFHHTLGFPNGRRNEMADFKFAYTVTDGDKVIYAPKKPGFSLGDMSVETKYRVLDEGIWYPSVALRGGLKFPTGSFENGTGSGKFDGSLGFAAQKTVSRFIFYIGGDYILLGVPKQLAPLVKRNIFHYDGGVEFAIVKDMFSFIMMLDGQTTPYAKTGLWVFDNSVLELVTGMRGSHLKGQLFWSIFFTEDMIFSSSVDFTASGSLGVRF